ncbi:MAG: sulfatase [Armatimonadota bacterium]|nr:MAG: sulfatase [Armatimonadota bacterium]
MRMRLLLACLLGASTAIAACGCGRERAAPIAPPPAEGSGKFTTGETYLQVGSDRESGPAPRRIEAPSRAAAEKLRAAAKSANLVICIIDAARADHVGCYGYSRDTTPNIDRLARDAMVFEQHFAPYCQTKPSTASLFTGLYPDTHLVVGNSMMPADQFTMARGLASGGLETVLFSSNPVASPAMGIGEDFRTVFTQRQGRERLADSTPEALLGVFSRWLEQGHRSRFFAYLHFVPPHLPYDAPPVLKELFAGQEPPNAWQGGFRFPEVEPRERGREPPPLDEWVNLYDANLRWADWAVGQVGCLLQERGVLDNTILVVTSDHGEAFREHGYKYHSRGLYDELLHAPLIIRFPGEERVVGRVSALTQTVDLLPTVFELFGIPYPREEVQGHSLLPLISGEASRVREYVYAASGGRVDSYLIRDQRSALILFEGGRVRALYDLERNPRQTRNVIEDQPERAAEMVAAFRAFAETQRRPPLHFIEADAKAEEVPRPPEVKLSDETRRDLRALGYLY